MSETPGFADDTPALATAIAPFPFRAVSYFSELFGRALHDSWHVFPGKGVGAIVIAASITLHSIHRKHRQKRTDEAKVHFTDWLMALFKGFIAFTTIFLVHFLVITPKTIVEECRNQQSTNPTLSLPNNAGNTPWVSMELAYVASGSSDENNKTVVDHLHIEIVYKNRGATPALDMNGTVVIAGHFEGAEFPESIASGEDGSVRYEYTGQYAAHLDEAFTYGKSPIKCDVSYHDLNGREFGFDYEWHGQGLGKSPSLPKIKLKGEYLKFRQP